MSDLLCTLSIRVIWNTRGKVDVLERVLKERWIKDTYHLQGEHANHFDSVLAIAHVEEVFEVGPEEVDDEHVVQTFLTEVMRLREIL